MELQASLWLSSGGTPSNAGLTAVSLSPLLREPSPVQLGAAPSVAWPSAREALRRSTTTVTAAAVGAANSGPTDESRTETLRGGDTRRGLRPLTKTAPLAIGVEAAGQVSRLLRPPRRLIREPQHERLTAARSARGGSRPPRLAGAARA